MRRSLYLWSKAKLRLLGEAKILVVLGSEMFSAKESGINGPCPGTDHGSSATQRGQNDRNPRIVDVSHSGSKFDYGNQRSDNRRPEANEEKYAGAGCNHQWNR